LATSPQQLVLAALSGVYRMISLRDVCLPLRRRPATKARGLGSNKNYSFT
jgi:hypothetical protein